MSAALGCGIAWPGSACLELAVSPVLAAMLFSTFLQIPISELRQTLWRGHFLAALLVVNFVVVPLIVLALVSPFGASVPVRFGMMLVLLTPCVDYVVPFTQLGKGDARLMLAATPVLLVAQMLLLPLYVSLFLGPALADLIRVGPFLRAFVTFLVAPAVLAAITQAWARRSHGAGQRTLDCVLWLQVPLLALVLFLVVAAFTPRLESARAELVRVLPIYVAFAVTSPLAARLVATAFRLDVPKTRALMFSAGTRNALVVLPLAYAVGGGAPLLPALVVAQTVVELAFELVYIWLIPRIVPNRPDPLRSP